MTLANDSILVTPGSGATVATHTVGSKEHQVVMTADENGHVGDSTPTYTLFVPKQTPGANVVFFDLFNASGSGKTLKILHCVPVYSGAAAETGTLGIDLFLTRTSAVGTGGTAAVGDGSSGGSSGASLTACSIGKMNPSDSALPSQVTARLTPSGGATAAQVLAMTTLFTEETSAASYLGNAVDMVHDRCPVIVTEGTGVRIVQGSEANTEGQVAYEVIFQAV